MKLKVVFSLRKTVLENLDYCLLQIADTLTQCGRSLYVCGFLLSNSFYLLFKFAIYILQLNMSIDSVFTQNTLSILLLL